MTRVAPITPEPIEPTTRGPMTHARRRRIAERQGWTCARSECSTDLQAFGFHIDHIKPLIDGGEDDDTNCEAVCLPCHIAKTAREAKERAKAKRCYLKDNGLFPKPRRPLKGRGFQPRYVERDE